MLHPACQAYIVPSPSMDYLYQPVSVGWSIWAPHALDAPFQAYRGFSPEIESVWLDCIE